jgi:hypothetical protein
MICNCRGYFLMAMGRPSRRRLAVAQPDGVSSGVLVASGCEIASSVGRVEIHLRLCFQADVRLC